MLTNSSSRIGKLASLVLGAALLAGCGTNVDDLQEYVKNAKNKPVVPPETRVDIPVYETARYAVSDKRDPFVQVAFGRSKPKRIGTGGGPDPNRPKEELEQFPLDTLKMVGTMQRDGGRFALIASADGTIHRITSGDHLGQNNGKVVRIEEGRVHLMQWIQVGEGDWIQEPESIAIAE